MDTPHALLGYALGSLYGALTIGGPLMWSLIALSGLVLRRGWHVAVAALAFLLAFQLFAPMTLKQAAFQAVTIALVAALGRAGRLLVLRMRPQLASA